MAEGCLGPPGSSSFLFSPDPFGPHLHCLGLQSFVRFPYLWVGDPCKVGRFTGRDLKILGGRDSLRRIFVSSLPLSFDVGEGNSSPPVTRSQIPLSSTFSCHGQVPNLVDLLRDHGVVFTPTHGVLVLVCVYGVEGVWKKDICLE